MPTILPAMGLTLPVRGTAGAGQWADAIDADLTKLDAHNHAAGKGNPVPTAGIAIDADLTFSGTWAPTNLQRIQFAKIADNALTNSNNLSLFVSDGTGALVNNELYYRNSTGNPIRFTNGNSLNSAAFVGGIGGDYSAVGAQLNYDDSTKRYKLTNGSADSPAHGWALLHSGSVRISETATTETQYVGLVCPTALASQYNITLPLAAPASTKLLQMDSSGVLTVDNTIVQPATFSGLITASAGVTAAVDQNITVSGVGVIKHGLRTFSIPLSAPISAGTGGAAWNVTLPTNTSGQQLQVPIRMELGQRILGFRVRVLDNATGSTKVNTALGSVTDGTAALGTNVQSSGLGALQTLSQSGLTIPIVSGTNYYVTLTTSADNACKGYYIEIDYDRP